MQDDHDFWTRTTAREELELRRREEREQHAAGWRRNILGAIVLALLLWVLQRVWP